MDKFEKITEFVLIFVKVACIITLCVLFMKLVEVQGRLVENARELHETAVELDRSMSELDRDMRELEMSKQH